MALRVIQSPGCADLYSDSELGLRPVRHPHRHGKDCRKYRLQPDRSGSEPGTAQGGVSFTWTGDQGRSRGWDLRRRQNVQREGWQALLGVTGATRVEVVHLTRSRSVQADSQALTEQSGPGSDVRAWALIGILRLRNE